MHILGKHSTNWVTFVFFFLRIRFVFVTQANRTSRSPCLSFLCWHCKCGLHLSLSMPVVCCLQLSMPDDTES